MTVASKSRSVSEKRTSSGRARGGWRRDPEGKRLRILDAATRLAGERGHVGVRTSDIARSAGVSEGTIFHQFGNKNGLFVAVAERYAQGFYDAMFDSFDAEAESPDLESVFHRAFAYVRYNSPDFAAFLLAAQDSDGRTARNAYRELIVGRLADFYSLSMELGRIRRGDARILAELSFGVVETALRECFTCSKRDREADYISEVVNAIRGMLGLIR